MKRKITPAQNRAIHAKNRVTKTSPPIAPKTAAPTGRELATKFTRVYDNTPDGGFRYKVKGSYGPFYTRKQAEALFKKLK